MSIPWRCAECGRNFATPGGGICYACGRVLCLDCLGANRLKLTLQWHDPVCKVCQTSQAEAKPISPSPSERL